MLVATRCLRQSGLQAVARAACDWTPSRLPGPPSQQLFDSWNDHLWRGMKSASGNEAAQPQGLHVDRSREPGSTSHDPLVVNEKTVLYKGAGMRVFRILVRFKVAQLGAVGATGALLTAAAGMADTPLLHTLAAGGLLVGAGAASGALWYMSRRYVGELALLPPDQSGTPRLVVSVMDFWGNREVRLGKGDAAIMAFDARTSPQFCWCR